MQLSILIPIFNFDIRPLVADLHGQCEALGIGYEIACFDDGSKPAFKALNKETWKLPNVVYREMPENLGRSAIRNALGKAARFDLLLFMDCDSKLVSPDFVKKYLETASPDCLVYGGRCYAEEPPADQSLYFHWHYGRCREQTTAAGRSRSPYHSFMTNNFLIPKAIFLDILFDETLRQYGHEDTLFGMELARKKVPILHIDNPLEHIGLEPLLVFLRKTEQGVENLAKLRKEGKPVETKLLATYDLCRNLGLNKLLSCVLPKAKPLIISKLTKKNPSLRWFDLYKLSLFCRQLAR
jgi:glycosyltransferase involved in cell wall biosynthesis